MTQTTQLGETFPTKKMKDYTRADIDRFIRNEAADKATIGRLNKELSEAKQEIAISKRETEKACNEGRKYADMVMSSHKEIDRLNYLIDNLIGWNDERP